MFDKTTDVDKRLKEFREIRRVSSTEEEVLECFSQIKIHNRYLDYWSPAEWMKPFDIIELLSADNNVTPPTSNAIMKYVVRKWKSQ